MRLFFLYEFQLAAIHLGEKQTCGSFAEPPVQNL